MKLRGAAVQGVLAVGALVVAYATWQTPEQSPGESSVVDLSRNDLTRIHYEDGLRWVELDRRSEGSESGVWMRYGTREPPPTLAADGGVPDGGVSPDAGVLASTRPSPPKLPPREVRASESAEKLFERFAPLRASRALGVLEPDKLKELGLDGSNKVLTLTGRRGTYSFKVATALGVGTPYIQSEQDHRVYLIGSAAFSDLDSASVRLLDRRLHRFKANEFDAFTVKMDDKRRELVSIAKEPPAGPAKVASKKTPDKADDFARNWHEKVFHLIPIDVLGKGEVPSSGEPEVGLRVDYSFRGKPIGWIELGESKAAGASAVDVYVRTEHTVGWVKVHGSAEDILKEAKKVASES